LAKTSESKSQLMGLSVGRAAREGMLWVGWALALILLWALLSYDPADRGFASTGAGGGVSNAAGPIGAWISSFLYVLFGHAAYLFPVLLAGAGWLALKSRAVSGMAPGRVLGIRIGGFAVMLAASCGLATLHFAANGLPETAGGILGQLAGLGLASMLSFLGATLLLLALWLAGVSLFTGVSWLALMDRVGQATLAALAWAQRAVEGARGWLAGRKAAQARQESVELKKQRVVRKSPPRIEPVIAPVEKSERVEKERQAPLFETPAPGEIPPLGLLDEAPPAGGGYSEDALEAMSRLVELKLRDFGVEVEVVAVHPGPVVTRFELAPAPGVKVSQISNLAKDLARALSAVAVRVVEVIPGKPTIGLEIPNETRELVTLGEILTARAYDEMKSPLALALGKDIGGAPTVADLARMPHLLIAGTTGSGKSVAINAMVLSLLYKATPEQVRLIMVDPKMLELSVYEGIPHLLAPVVTDMKEAANALRWCVAEMERRYRLMATLGVRNIGGFNRKLKEAEQRGEPLRDPLFNPAEHLEGTEAPLLTPLPFIVVVVDELADMMMVVGKKVEELIARLAQKARASGIHLVLATQRPSVDVITGLIKANIPSRIAFQVSARVDSRTILDQMGAESLLGHGDMLYLPPGTGVPQRVHGAFVSDAEVHRVVKHLKASGAPVYLDEVLEGPSQPIPGLSPQAGGEAEGDGEQDALYDEAVRIVTETRKASISGVQRRLKIGYNRAARLVETMEEAGLVGSLQPNGSREVLAPPPPKD